MTINGTDSNPPEPEKELAALFKSELGVEINPQALRLFVRWHWPRVRLLAHAIHGTPIRETKP